VPRSLSELEYVAAESYTSGVLFRVTIYLLIAVCAWAAEPPAAQLLAGDRLPDPQFVDAHGKPWRWSDFRGKPVAFTFIFTRCPMPDFCIRMTRHFREADLALQKAPIAGGWQLVSLTIDPAYDKPEVLAAYAAAQQAGATHWTFATGEAAEIAKLAGPLGAGRVGEMPTHNLRTVVVGPDGRIRRIFPGNEWKPEELVEEMRRAAGDGTSNTQR
jgi:protein SCO1/2